MANEAPISMSGQAKVGMLLSGTSAFQGPVTLNLGDINHFVPTSPLQNESTGKIGNFNFDLTPLQGIIANRDCELERIRAALAKPAASGAKIAILVGIGGSGKTSLTKMYKQFETMNLVNEPFENFIWIDAKEPETVMAAFENLAHKDNLKVDGSFNTANLVETVYNSILRHKTIIVFDNVEKVEDTKKFLPKHTPSGSLPPCILITTRVTAGWRDYKKHVVNVTQLSSRASRDYILKTLAEIPDVDDKWKELAEHFGGLAVALRAASLYITKVSQESQQCGQTYTLGTFLSNFEEKNAILEQEPLLNLWTSTLDILTQRPCRQLSERILAILAYMSSPEGLPVSVFAVLLQDFPECNKKNWSQEIEFLCSWSLVQQGSRGSNYGTLCSRVTCFYYSVHRVLQMTLLNRIEGTPGKRDETLDWLLPAVERLYCKLYEFQIFCPCPNLEVLLSNIESDTRGNVPDSVVSFLVRMNKPGMEACGKLRKQLIQNVEKGVAFVSPESLKQLERVDWVWAESEGTEELANSAETGSAQEEGTELSIYIEDIEDIEDREDAEPDLRSRFRNCVAGIRKTCYPDGSVHTWLLILVGANVMDSLFGIFKSGFDIVAINDQWDAQEPTERSEYWLALIISCFLVVGCIFDILVNCMPIFAETIKKPILHLAYRNWTVIILMFEFMGLIRSIAGIGIPPGGAATALQQSYAEEIVAVCITVLTVLIANRRVKELQREIGWSRFNRTAFIV